MYDSYLRLSHKDSALYTIKANEVYQQALKWYGQKFMEEKWESITDVYDGQFNDYDSLASFPGGRDAYSSYLTTHIRYPQKAKIIGIEGSVIVGFVVNTDGIKGAFHIYKGLGEDLDEEAIRVICEAPDFVPATKEGERVYSNMLLPVSFKLPEKTR